MKDYRAEDLKQDTKEFLDSQYGQYLMTIFTEMSDGFLCSAANMAEEYPERYLAKYSALKEVIDLIRQPLDDDQRAGG